MEKVHDYMTEHVCPIQDDTLESLAGRCDIEADCDIARISTVCGQPCRGTRSLRACYLKLRSQRPTRILHTQLAKTFKTYLLISIGL